MEDFDQLRFDETLGMLGEPIFMALLTNLVAATPGYLHRLAAYAESAAFNGMAREAHELVGVSANLGAARIEREARALQAACAAENLIAARDAVAAMPAAFQETWRLIDARLRKADFAGLAEVA